MKAKYEAPKMEVINFDMTTSLLAGSPIEEKGINLKDWDDDFDLDDGIKSGNR